MIVGVVETFVAPCAGETLVGVAKKFPEPSELASSVKVELLGDEPLIAIV